MERGVRERRERLAERLLERAVDLHHVQVRDPRGEELRQHAQPAAHLEHDVVIVELRRLADHAQDVVVDQEVLAELAIRADAEGAQPAEAGLARLAPLARLAHGPSRRARRSHPPSRSSSSYSMPRSSATKRAVCVTFAGSFGFPRTGCGAR